MLGSLRLVWTDLNPSSSCFKISEGKELVEWLGWIIQPAKCNQAIPSQTKLC